MAPRTLVRFIAIGMIAVTALFTFTVNSGAFSDTKAVRVRDDCDPTTFNAVIGPGTCVGDGKTTFGDFIARITRQGFDPAWRFDPGTFDVVGGKSLLLVGVAGEVHTFTKVAEFGGGFIPPLNTILGLTARPECAAAPFVPQPPSPTNIFIEPGEEEDGPTAGSAELPVGTTKWQCCIHPWMHALVKVN